MLKFEKEKSITKRLRHSQRREKSPVSATCQWNNIEFSPYLVSFPCDEVYMVSVADSNTEWISHHHAVEILAAETLPELHNCFVAESLAQFECCASWNWEFIPYSRIVDYRTLVHDRSQLGHFFFRVMAPQYSSAAWVSLRFHFLKDKIDTSFKNVFLSFVILFLEKCVSGIA